MPLPLDPSLVKIVFTKLFLIYGARFMGQYGTASPQDIEADWAHELSGVSRQAILYALQNLPSDYPVNVLQFRDLCRRKPLPPFKAIQAPVATPEQVQNLSAQLTARKPKGKDPMAWAHRMRDRELEGRAKLSVFQKQAWRAALGDNEE